MKRSVLFITAAAAAVSFSVPAVFADDDSAAGYAYDNKVYTEYNDGDASAAVLSFYNDGVLSYSAMAMRTESGYSFNVPEEYLGERARICYIGGGIFDMEIEEMESPSASPSASPEASEAPSASPEATASPAPERTPVPEAYERELDAIHAPAVVMGISQTQIDGEYYDTLRMLYQGSEVTVSIRDQVTIVSAPDASEYLVGQGTDALREGDVIHLTADLQGRVRSIEFIYRPDFQNYVVSGGDYGTDFSKLISDSGVVANQSGCSVASYSRGTSGSGTQYAFGVPVDVRGNVLTMANEDGTAMDVYVNSKAMVYTVRNSSRGDNVEFAGNGCNAVDRTYVPDSAFDENGNISSWSDIDVTSYALVRIVNGTATDIVVFTL